MKTQEYFEDAQKELIKQYRDAHSKYVHYQLVLCVAAIGYSVSLSLGLKLVAYQIPLGLAVGFWAISIIYGFSALANELLLIKTNHEHFNIILNTTPKTLTEKEQFEGNNKYRERLEDLSQKTPKFKRNQEMAFYTGIVCFIVWCVLKMSLN